jgi:anti-sigma B factor antagonist
MDKPELSIAVTAHASQVTITAAGDVDYSNAPALLDAATRVLVDRPERLMVDLGAVTFLDSAGVAALLRIHSDGGSAECHVAFIDVPAHVHRVLALTGLTEFLHVQPRPNT